MDATGSLCSSIASERVPLGNCQVIAGNSFITIVENSMIQSLFTIAVKSIKVETRNTVPFDILPHFSNDFVWRTNKPPAAVHHRVRAKSTFIRTASAGQEGHGPGVSNAVPISGIKVFGDRYRVPIRFRDTVDIFESN